MRIYRNVRVFTSKLIDDVNESFLVSAARDYVMVKALWDGRK
jgi:hypothetical protein